MASKKAKGKRSKTRDLLKRRLGKTSVDRLLRLFSIGQNVTIKLDPSVHAGFLHRRFQNITGTIVEKRGESYVVSVVHGDKPKQLITTAAHLVVANAAGAVSGK